MLNPTRYTETSHRMMKQRAIKNIFLTYYTVYVMHKLWIGTIHRLPYANHISIWCNHLRYVRKSMVVTCQLV